MRREIPVSVRRLIVQVELEGLNVTEFCRQHGVSTWFFYQLRKRYAVQGEAALEPGSRVPKTIANQTSERMEELIIEIRKDLAGQGLDAGAATIRFHLENRPDLRTGVPSESTIWRILTRRGFVNPEPKKAPKHSYRTFAAERANECWQIDDTDWFLADGTGVKIISLIDDCTRFCPGIKACQTVNGTAAFEAFTTAAGQWGWPQRFLSDNASVYRYSLAETLGLLGVGHRHGRPHHPQTQGKVERFQQTLQKWLRSQPHAETIEELQAQLDQFCDIYNNQRPHRALDRRTPASVYDNTPKAGPADRPLATPTSIYQVTVTGGACHINKRYSIAIGAAHNGHTATVIITGTSCHVFIGSRLIRQLELDPTRRYQPLYDRPGKP